MYREFKKDFVFEKYLQDNNVNKYRTSLTRFRISAHTLAIERGRYIRPPIPVKDRLCIYCDQQCIEDEVHIFQCSFYSDLRVQFNIENVDKTKFQQLMCKNDNNIAAYIYNCFEKRNS